MTLFFSLLVMTDSNSMDYIYMYTVNAYVHSVIIKVIRRSPSNSRHHTECKTLRNASAH